MGLFDRIAEKLAAEIAKSPGLPTGAIAMTESQMRNPTNGNTSYGNSVPLPRDNNLATVPFAPGNPLIPGAINPPSEDGRPDPRRFEFQVAQNINITATRLIPFSTLRAAADQIDILRRCIEVKKAKMRGLDWDIVLGEDATERIIKDQGGTRERAMVEAKEQFTDEIARVRDFWETPDKANGLTFTDWLNIALEEILVIDGLAIFPQKTVGGDLHGFQILDSTTIKPLIDDRGMRPVSPYPAFQQILYGFPRSEFTAPDETEQADGEFTSDELSYSIYNRRANTVYGYSPTERALAVADIYLRRQQWLRAEFTDGVTPELLMTTDANFGNNPDLLRAYENIFNNDLSGQTEQRKRVRLLPTGMVPIQLDGYGEKFSDSLDEYLVNSVCGHYGVMPTEIGFMPKGGIGGSGIQQGQAESSMVISDIPFAEWVGKILTNLSYLYLGMPRELEFRFMASNREDVEATSRAQEIDQRNGKLTINEGRSHKGLPLIDSPEADMPMMVVGSTAFLLKPEGIVPFVEPPAPVAPVLPNGEPVDENAPEKPAAPTEEPNTEETTAEVKAFMKWVSKGKRARLFEFKSLDPIVGEALNKCAFDGDMESARALAKAYLP